MAPENLKYWVIEDGLRRGPLTYDELVRLNLQEDTPVWREGLTNWVAAKDIPELSDLFISNIPPVPGYGEIKPTVYDQALNYTPRAKRENIMTTETEVEPMPRTYMAWSIIAMLLCCLFPGIVALIYSTKVSSRYSNGDYDGAKRASELAGMWIIVTVICGIIAIPFQIIMALL